MSDKTMIRAISALSGAPIVATVVVLVFAGPAKALDAIALILAIAGAAIIALIGARLFWFGISGR